MPLLSVRHVTTYRYRRPVTLGQHRLMFRPRDSYDQKLLEAQLDVTPRPASVRWLHDVFGNCVTVVDFATATDELRFETSILLEHHPTNVPDFQIEEHARVFPFAYGPEEMPDLAPVIAPAYPDPNRTVERWANRFVRPGHSTETGTLLMTMTHAFKEGFRYERRTARGTRAPASTLELGRGSCRDFALLMMEAARSLGFAARFVSGYIYVAGRDGPRHAGGGATHAWVQIYLPGAGWVEFDPTNAIIGNRDLIRVAVARDPSQAVPLWGTYDGAAEDCLDMTVEVRVVSEPERRLEALADA